MLKILTDFLLYVNIVGGFLVSISNITLLIKGTYRSPIWICWAYIILGLYWGIVYTILASTSFKDPYLFTSSYIRPATSFLIVLVCSDFITQMKRLYIPDVIKNLLKKGKDRGSLCK